MMYLFAFEKTQDTDPGNKMRAADRSELAHEPRTQIPVGRGRRSGASCQRIRGSNIGQVIRGVCNCAGSPATDTPAAGISHPPMNGLRFFNRLDRTEQCLIPFWRRAGG